MDYGCYAVHAVRTLLHRHRVDPYCRPTLYAKGDPVQSGNRFQPTRTLCFAGSLDSYDFPSPCFIVRPANTTTTRMLTAIVWIDKTVFRKSLQIRSRPIFVRVEKTIQFARFQCGAIHTNIFKDARKPGWYPTISTLNFHFALFR